MTATAAELAARVCPGDPLDLGVARYVATLRDAGVETFESCEGGSGHSFDRPTVKFYGTHAAGWHELAASKDAGFPVVSLCRSWDVDDGEPSGPYWAITFRSKSD